MKWPKMPVQPLLQLLYSGNFEGFVQKNQLNEVRVGLGINPENFSWELAPNQSFDTPVAMISYSHKGLTGLSQESQAFVQDHIIPSPFAHKERPILINNWEATYFDFKKDKLLELADEAQKVGIELFVLDDGWFGNRYDDNRALWWLDGQWRKLGGSLAALIQGIHDKGLQFGLWWSQKWFLLIATSTVLIRTGLFKSQAMNTPIHGIN